MTGHNGNHGKARIEAYLDALHDPLRAEQREDLRRVIAADPELRDDLARQQTIDELLSRQFAPPSPARVLGVVERAARLRRAAAAAPAPLDSAAAAADAAQGGATAGGGGAAGQWLRSWAAAAIIGAGAVATIWTAKEYVWPRFASQPAMVAHDEFFHPRYAPRSAESIYHGAAGGESAPEHACGSAGELEEVLRARLGQPLAVSPLPPGVAMLGANVGARPHGRSLVLLARVGDQPVVVTLDAFMAKGVFLPPADGGLSIFRRDLGPVVLHEITPLDRPHLLDLFQLAAAEPGARP